MTDRIVSVPLATRELPEDVKVPAARISDSTESGRALLTGADAAAQRELLGLGTAAVTDADEYATAAQGAKADATEVEQVTLTAPLVYALPTGLPSGVVHRVTFTQDGAGGHTVTYGGQPVTVDLTAGASTAVEIWPGGRITYPGSPLAQIGTLVLPEAPRPGETVTLLASSATAIPAGVRWDSGGEPTIDVYDELILSFVWRGDAWLGTYGLPIPIPDTTAPTAGTLAASAVGETGWTLTVSGARDDRAVTGYSFDDGSGTFGAWQSAATLAVTGKTAGTTYTCRHKVRDAAGNESTGASIQVAPQLSMSSAILALTPTAYWQLDEASGTVATDSSGNGLHGEYVDAVTLGGPDGALFAGGHVAVPDSDLLSVAGSAAGFTIFAIASRPNASYGSRQFLVSKGGAGYEWSVEYTAAPNYVRTVVTSSVGNNIMGDRSNATIGSGWHAICSAIPPYVNGARIPCYRDSGTPVETTQSTISAGDPGNTTSPVWLGGRSDSADLWTGSIRHVAIFRRQLSDAEVGGLMTAARDNGLIP